MDQVTSHILMVRPQHFGFNIQTADNNNFQENIPVSEQEKQQSVLASFDNFVETLRRKGISVLVVEDTDTPIKPDAIFPNNWFCSLHDGSFYLFPMFAPNRRLERRPDIISLLQSQFFIRKVEDWSIYEKENGILEGTGSIVFDHLNRQLFACLSPRTDEMLVEKFAKQIGYKPIIFTAEDEQEMLIYHTNVMMHIGTDYAVLCEDSIRSKQERDFVTERLTLSNRKLISITLDQVHQFAGNMLQVKNKEGDLFTVLSAKAYASLTETQKETIQSSSTLLPINIDIIETIGGGSARCMMAEIFFEEKK